eukprot:TRINITY_DN10626_c0_g1_i1.p1 TRINITY_DN10626_c0_g1~~TRINITY_DN10626_c0_g1_i1.p1  ORF type:complete len:454 (-),score=125.44 TRINITY_DN10626_c0_g1_i1:34-1395(-)
MDINLFRVEKGGNPDIVRESQRRRGKPVESVDVIIELDEKWRKLRFNVDQLNKQATLISKGVAEKKKKGEDTTELQEQSKELKKKIAEAQEESDKAEKERDEKLYAVGNLVHQSVPTSMDEKDNGLVKTWGTNRDTTADLKHHHQLLYMIDGYESEAGVEVAGHRGYYLKGFGLLLNQALINYGLAYLASKGYTPMQPPFFMKKSVMGKVAALAEFDEALYQVQAGEGDDYYLIATSEQPLCAVHMGQNITGNQLPIKYVGYSSCFRKEAGSHGKDVWGIFRVHQFEKIEQFVLCAPDKSWDMHEEMLAVSEEFMQNLGFSYRVVNIVSGELNNAAAKKYDLEAWFPTLGVYRELVSCSNCTDYQARRLDIKYGTGKNADGSAAFVHMLNSTLCATERTLCCLLENYQTEKGIRIPKVLQPYLAPFMTKMEDPEIIPFTRTLPTAKGGKKKEN